MKEIPIPVPSDKKAVVKIVGLVDGLASDSFNLTRIDELKEMEASIQRLVDGVLAEA